MRNFIGKRGDNFRSFCLNVRSDGTVRLDAQDMGKFVEEVWGDDDYEFWVDVPATELNKLVFALLRAKYSGRSGAVDEFREFCKKKGLNTNGILGYDGWPEGMRLLLATPLRVYFLSFTQPDRIFLDRAEMIVRLGAEQFR